MSTFPGEFSFSMCEWSRFRGRVRPERRDCQRRVRREGHVSLQGAEAVIEFITASAGQTSASRTEADRQKVSLAPTCITRGLEAVLIKVLLPELRFAVGPLRLTKLKAL